MQTKYRIFHFDLLRATAIIAVIMCHVSLFFSPPTTFPQEIAQYVFQDIGAIGVPIFLMISGALLLDNNYELKDFFKKRLRRIALPFLFWMAIILTLIYFFNGDAEYMANILLGNNEFTWYFWVILAIYLTMPVFNRILKKYGLESLRYFLIFWLLIIVIETFAGEDLNIIVSFIGYLGYPILGYYLNNKQISRPTAGLVMMLVSLALIVYLHYTHSNLISLGYLSLPILSIGLGAFVFIKNLPETKSETVKKAIESISISSYGMYFAHILLIKMFLMFNLHLRFIITFAVIIFTSWLMTYALGKIPYVKLFSGSMID